MAPMLSMLQKKTKNFQCESITQPGEAKLSYGMEISSPWFHIFIIACFFFNLETGLHNTADCYFQH